MLHFQVVTETLEVGNEGFTVFTGYHWLQGIGGLGLGLGYAECRIGPAQGSLTALKGITQPDAAQQCL